MKGERENPTPCSKCWTKILGEYICGAWMGQCRLFWVSGYLSLWWYDGVNVEAKPLMGKRLFVTD